MAQDYQASVEPDALPGRPAPRFPDEVGAAFEGSAVGQGIENAGSVMQAVHEHAMEQVRQTQVIDANNRLQSLSTSLTHDPQSGAFTKQGKDAFGLPQQYLPKYDQASQTIIDSIPDARARLAATQAAQHTRNQLSEQLDAHEIEQHRQFGIQTAQASVKIAQQSIGNNYNHPDIIASNLDTIDLSVDNLGKQQGWSDDQIAEAKQQSHSSAHSDVIDRMLSDNKIGMAQTYLNATKKDMDANTAFRAQRTIDAEVKQKENEQKQDIADRYTDSMQAAQFGLPNAITVSRKEMDVLYPKDAQRRWDGLQMVAAAGAQAKEYDRMTPAEIQADLDQKKPTQGGPEAAYQIHSYEMLSHAANESIKARNADPAQFAIDSGAGWKPLNLQDPATALAELRGRANSAGTVGQQIGGPVALLSKTEAKQFGDAVERSTPAQRLQTLNTLHQALPDENAYFAVLHQIAPQSPVTAIVGAKVGKPDPMHTPSWYDSSFSPNIADAEKILAGEQLLNPAKGQKEGEKGGFKEGFPLPPDAGSDGLRSVYAKAAGDMFRDRPELADAHYSAFRAAYAALLSEKGNLKGIADNTVAKQALKMSLGNTTDFNGQTLSVPIGMDPAKFEGTVDKAVASSAVAYGAPPDWKDRLHGYQLRELGALGSGRYELVNGNAPLIRPDGKGTFIIDLKTQFQPRFEQ